MVPSDYRSDQEPSSLNHDVVQSGSYDSMVQSDPRNGMAQNSRITHQNPLKHKVQRDVVQDGYPNEAVRSSQPLHKMTNAGGSVQAGP